MQNNTVNKENFEKWNDSMVQQYGTVLDSSKTGAIHRWIESRRVRALIGMLKPKDDDTILDVGCGAGNILEEVSRGKLFGLDLSSVLLERAREHLGNRAIFVKGNAEEMAGLFEANQFSKIFSSEVIEHVLNPDKVIEQMSILLKPDGVLIISIPNEWLIKILKRVLIGLGLFRVIFPKYKKSQAEYEWHLHDFDLAMLRRIVSGKFVIKKIRRIPFWFLPLRYVVELRRHNTSQ